MSQEKIRQLRLLHESPSLAGPELERGGEQVGPVRGGETENRRWQCDWKSSTVTMAVLAMMRPSRCFRPPLRRIQKHPCGLVLLAHNSSDSSDDFLAITSWLSP